jgi:CheY-like chemotaxis protein
LDTARGRVVVPGSLVDAGALVEEVVEVLSPKAMHRGVVLDVTAEEGLMVAGSRADLFTIAWNLIQNAIEATPLGGGVKVSLEATRRGARLRITDEGSGISDDIRTRVFEPYFTTKEDGTGLGLSLVRRAADALGASVALEDSDAGACFVCELPTTVPGAEAPPRRQSGVLERQSPRGKRILVVDDDEAMRDLLATTLGLAGATVETAGSGEEALQTTGHFDLVLIDFSLGDARGDQLLSDLQGRGQVGASALVSGASLPPTLAASPDAWLRKPFELDDLLGAISSLLSSTIDKDVRSG